MGVRYEYVDTGHPFFSVTVQPDPNPDDDEEFENVDDVLVIAYDEAIVITGDLQKFARLVNRAVRPPGKPSKPSKRKKPQYQITITTDSRSVYETIMDDLDGARLKPKPKVVGNDGYQQEGNQS